ncbi:hypothetical protein [Arenimonas daejeonensis]|uniref:hypothetical protein n=1 Tax=Arenimonas daejeonensis TaxID=370777 RepID=UPI0011BE7BEF|nr:hypothetical protein [Arenimonas daejeonensis]
MSLAEKEAAVRAAELRCEGQRQAAQDALGQLKSEFRRSATPVRIVVSGLALGFASGLRTPGSGPIASLGGQLLSGPLMSLVMESVLPGLLAGVTAAAATAEETADETPDGTVAEAMAEAEAEAEEEAEAAAEPVRKPRRRRRKKNRVDA